MKIKEIRTTLANGDNTSVGKTLEYVGSNMVKWAVALLFAGLINYLIYKKEADVIYYLYWSLILTILGYGIQKFHSRFAALLFIIVLAYNFVTSVIFAVHGHIYWLHLILVLLLFPLATASFLLAHKWHGLLQTRLCFKHIFLKTLLAVLYSITFLLVFLLCTSWINGHIFKMKEHLWLFSFFGNTIVVLAVSLTFAGYLPFSQNMPFVHSELSKNAKNRTVPLTKGTG